MAKELPSLGELEMRVLRLVWQQQPCTERQITDVIPLGGGIPIKVGEDTIGAIGVSGAPGQEKDEACAQAGLARVADQLK